VEGVGDWPVCSPIKETINGSTVLFGTPQGKGTLKTRGRWNNNININLRERLCHDRYWSLTLREEYRLRVFEERALKRMLGPKRGEVT
jgi:hypothetical protein